nr:EVE domain-containing protein [Alkalicoccus halolimnae]
MKFKNSHVVINTNYKHNPQAHSEMLREGKAAAYYHPWKEKIKRIQKGDKVFLYQSGRGIVAIGIGTGVVDAKDYKGQVDEEYFTSLNSFQKLKAPLSAREMKEIAGKNIVFQQTYLSLDEEAGEKIWTYITQNYLEEPTDKK